LISLEVFSRWHRVSRAVQAALIGVLFWYIIPSFLFSYLESGITALPVTPTFILAYGTVITALQVLGALTEGNPLSMPFNAGAALASAFYIYSAVHGGLLAFDVKGMHLALSFQPLVFLMIVPSLFTMLRVPLVYLLEHSEAGGQSPDTA
jgi:hypothetical protein